MSRLTVGVRHDRILHILQSREHRAFVRQKGLLLEGVLCFDVGPDLAALRRAAN